jgi:hypothetical protein
MLELTYKDKSKEPLWKQTAEEQTKSFQTGGVAQELEWLFCKQKSWVQRQVSPKNQNNKKKKRKNVSIISKR